MRVRFGVSERRGGAVGGVGSFLRPYGTLTTFSKGALAAANALRARLLRRLTLRCVPPCFIRSLCLLACEADTAYRTSSPSSSLLQPFRSFSSKLSLTVVWGRCPHTPRNLPPLPHLGVAHIIVPGIALCLLQVLEKIEEKVILGGDITSSQRTAFCG